MTTQEDKDNPLLAIPPFLQRTGSSARARRGKVETRSWVKPDAGRVRRAAQRRTQADAAVARAYRADLKLGFLDEDMVEQAVETTREK